MSKRKRSMSHKAWSRRHNNYEVRCERSGTIYLINGKRQARENAEVLGYLSAAFVRRSFTNPLNKHSNKRK